MSSMPDLSASSSSKRLWFLSYSRARTCSRSSRTLSSFCLRKTSPSRFLAMTRSVEAWTSRTRMRSLSPLELVTLISSALTAGTGSQHVMGAWRKSSMSWAPLRLKPVISPSSSMPMTSLPPDAFAKALMCLEMSLASFRALLRSKYWFSFSEENRFGSFCSMGCCIGPSCPWAIFYRTVAAG